MNFEHLINSYADFPKAGVLFWDFVPLLAKPDMYRRAIDEIYKQFNSKGITHVVAIEAKGFTLGATLAYVMRLPLLLIRKPDLIPGEVLTTSFNKEYGQGQYQMRANSLKRDDKVLIIYDILAEAGASKAAIELVESQNAKVEGCAYVIELEYLSGRKSLKNYDVFSLVKIKNSEV